jgi:hypothetical protein
MSEKFEEKTKEKSAGSGMLVPPFPQQRGGEGNISNPRVLSDMGLAILTLRALSSTSKRRGSATLDRFFAMQRNIATFL